MADKYIKDVPLIATPALDNKIPVSNNSTAASTISPAQIIALHTGATTHLTIGNVAGTAMAGDTPIPAAYILPIATTTELGGVMQGTNITIDVNGVISATASGTGDVVGPASAVDSNFVSFNTATGKLVKDSGNKAADFATAAQGGKADTAVQPGALGTAAAKNIPAVGNASATEVVYGSDTRLADARTPTAHNQTASTITDFNSAALLAAPAETNATIKTALGAATASVDGYATATQITKLDGLSNYTLPIAAGATLGGIKIGTGLSIDAGGVVSTTGTGSGHVIADEGTARTARATLNFIGAGVTATDNSGTNSTDVNIPSTSLLVAEQTVTGAAVTTMTFTGLDGDTHGGYDVILNIKNAVAATTLVYCYVNNDTTATNYYTEGIYASGTTISTSTQNTPSLTGVTASLSGFIKAELIRDIDGYFRGMARNSRNVGTSVITEITSITKTATTTNIVRLDFTASNASGLAVGSTISIYRRK